eukprot:1146506-Pelagomonas_calceolata.AAC.4
MSCRFLIIRPPLTTYKPVSSSLTERTSYLATFCINWQAWQVPRQQCTLHVATFRNFTLQLYREAWQLPRHQQVAEL